MKDFKSIGPNGKEVELVFRDPDIEDIERANSTYAAKVASIVRDPKSSLLTRMEVDRFLREKGIWSDKDTEQVTGLQSKIEKLLNKLKKGGGRLEQDGRKWAVQILDLRQEISVVMAKRQVFDDATIEALAENDKNDYLIWACVMTKDNENYWNSVDEMRSDRKTKVYEDAAKIGMEVLYGIDIEFEKNLPEIKWLKKYNFIDGELNYIDRRSGEKVDKNGKPIKKLQEELARRKEAVLGDISEETPFVDDTTGEPVEI